MAAVSALTTRSICLVNGKVSFWGETQEAIAHYLSSTQMLKGIYENTLALKKPAIVRVEVITSESEFIHVNGKNLEIIIDVHMPELIEGMALSLQVFNSREIAVIYAYVFDVENRILRKKGKNRYKCIIPNCQLYEDIYYLKVHLAESKGRTKFETLDRICEFEVKMMGKIIEWGWPKNVCVYTGEFRWEAVSV
jgi:lipopolysaccharide transport system ATP-binding protein